MVVRDERGKLVDRSGQIVHHISDPIILESLTCHEAVKFAAKRV